MEHYVTVFDSNYLPQGLTLHQSMITWCGDFTLWVVCMDRATEEILTDLDLPSVRLLPLRDLETPELLSVNESRTAGEYCWTLTPFTPDAVFEADPSVTRVTYLDADLWFNASPSQIFEEFETANAAVLITPHAFAPDIDASATSGIYCVQFVTFVKGESSPVLQEWKAQCLEWCFNRYEDGKLGDQKYLDHWPQDYPGLVHVLARPEWAQGPWNATRFPYSEAVFFHLQGLRLLSRKSVTPGMYFLPRPLVDHIYRPYLNSLGQSLTMLDRYAQSYSAGWTRQSTESRWRAKSGYWRRRFRLSISPTHMRIPAK